MVDLPRSDQALSVCRSHSIETQSHSSASTWSQVEAVLASYVAATIYAEAEARLKEITASRACHESDDGRVKSFGKVASTRLIRSIKISELSGTLAHFDAFCKTHFTTHLTDKQQTDWDSLVRARHDISHESDAPVSTITLNDIAGYYESVRDVIELYKASLYAEDKSASNSDF